MSRQFYNHEDNVMPRHRFTKQRRLPGVRETGTLMGFDGDYVLGGMDKHNKKTMDECRSMLGNSFCAPVVTWLLNHWAVAAQVFQALAPAGAGLNTVELSMPWTDADAYVARIEPVSMYEIQLASSYLRLSDHSSDIRIGFGVLFQPSCWPRASTQSRCWT